VYWLKRVCSVRHVRQQRDDPRTLDGDGKIALMLGAHARHAAGHDFAAFGYELFKGTDILVIDRHVFISAKLANLAAAAPLAGTHSAVFHIASLLIKNNCRGDCPRGSKRDVVGLDVGESGHVLRVASAPAPAGLRRAVVLLLAG
jgi:hypothetical protein